MHRCSLQIHRKIEMPELPEVETIARGVDERVRGERILTVHFSRFPQPFKTPAVRQKKGLEGRKLLAIHRTGKHIVCELSAAAPKERAEPEAQWIVHLGMTGRLVVTTAEAPVAQHTHARIRLESGRELRFVDPRRFGRLEWRNLKNEKPFAAAGMEPLTIGKRAFADLFCDRRLSIKAALLNQHLLTGVGNIYADESLFHAGIHPQRIAGDLSSAELERLRKALQQTLRRAIELGGSSVSDYVDAAGVKGFFQLEHCVYQREGEACRQCKSRIQRMIVAGRGTHFCPRCQR